MGMTLTIVCAAMLIVVVALLPIGTLVKLWFVKVVGISKFAPALVPVRSRYRGVTFRILPPC